MSVFSSTGLLVPAQKYYVHAYCVGGMLLGILWMTQKVVKIMGQWYTCI